ncbi:hypothetical protein M9H77_18434 [Catharanthus roseus]|uniref:Uncharacterized protein n=1 Tax=Catharanthus roseus TaxID=4058 RepID=A0ACC0B7F5_CATRO|nr:hypothetical protein M9H77_18434 [Catharanthus roseus]
MSATGKCTYHGSIRDILELSNSGNVGWPTVGGRSPSLVPVASFSPVFAFILRLLHREAPKTRIEVFGPQKDFGLKPISNGRLPLSSTIEDFPKRQLRDSSGRIER